MRYLLFPLETPTNDESLPVCSFVARRYLYSIPVRKDYCCLSLLPLWMYTVLNELDGPELRTVVPAIETESRRINIAGRP